jgi:hypothetical protein
VLWSCMQLYREAERVNRTNFVVYSVIIVIIKFYSWKLRWLSFFKVILFLLSDDDARKESIFTISLFCNNNIFYFLIP